ncbi:MULTISPECIES: nuclear transport factor 2 family protein [unclassified Streptomyces]|uniref:nuclear transport factor 2 family protein n=1 Tax=unclassified Streptomyces TaxID=2593676 RepID=UPI002E33C9F4|nr:MULTISPECIES: nuclear transport factor 2 family protein [unclassified Streptomyces]WUC67493.1 nuclear transport factor 2 family protein [Streptomyces sp. NBC_00539]
MTQRVDLATVLDRLAIDEVVSRYAVAVDDGDWEAYRALFTPAGRADYRSAGGVEGSAAEVADWLARTMTLFPVRQHLIVNRLVRLEVTDGAPGDTAQVGADFLNPMRLADTGSDPAVTTPNFAAAGRYAFDLARTRDGWRLSGVTVHEKWRYPAG